MKILLKIIILLVPLVGLGSLEHAGQHKKLVKKYLQQGRVIHEKCHKKLLNHAAYLGIYNPFLGQYNLRWDVRNQQDVKHAQRLLSIMPSQSKAIENFNRAIEKKDFIQFLKQNPLVSTKIIHIKQSCDFETELMMGLLTSKKITQKRQLFSDMLTYFKRRQSTINPLTVMSVIQNAIDFKVIQLTKPKQNSMKDLMKKYEKFSLRHIETETSENSIDHFILESKLNNRLREKVFELLKTLSI